MRDIIAADGLTANQKKSLLTTFQGIQASDRAIASSQRSNDLAARRDQREAAMAPYVAPQYKMWKEQITGQLKVLKGPFKDFSGAEQFAARQADTAELEFAQRVPSLKPSEYGQAAHEIIKRHMDMRSQLKEDAMTIPGAGMLRYPSYEAMLPNIRDLSTEEVEAHMDVYRQMREQAKAAARKPKPAGH